ncbi:MAG: sulfatase-like hydrolase/transferase [Planctomycetota bacterium]|nr:sulfatase-like hydrolase/transferase [Planctomycetota bacterium]
MFRAYLVLLLLVLGVGQSRADKPNVLFIFADDQTFNSIHSLGNQESETPNLDRLVKRGVTFTHAYNQGSWSGAVCVASRTMLVTGRFVWNANKVYQTSEAERAAGRFWPEYMKAAGYDTYFSGKWHIRANAEKAFNFASHVRPGMPNQTPAGYNRPPAGQLDKWKPWDPQFGGFWKGGKHWSEVLGDDAVEYVAQAAKRPKPFFMYLAFNAPHDPRQSPKEFVDKYPLDKIKIPASYVADYPYKDGIGCGKGLRDERLAPFPRTEHAVKVNRQEYYAIITHLDVQVGRMLDALEQSGKADNTYIFFSADHGLAVGHHGLMGKQNMYDHSVRVPLMVVGPDVPQDKKIDTPVYLQDIMATTLELAEVKKPKHVQFKSLLPIIRGERSKNYDSIYGAYLSLQRMVTQDGYKLIMYPQLKKALMFDLKHDPLEMTDLLGDAKHLAKARQLFTTFRGLQQETGDELDVASVFPQLAGGVE